MDAGLSAQHIELLTAFGAVIAYARMNTGFNNGWTLTAVLASTLLASLVMNAGHWQQFGIEAILGAPVVLGMTAGLNMAGEHGVPLAPKNNVPPKEAS